MRGGAFGKADAKRNRKRNRKRSHMRAIHERIAHGLVCEWPEYCADISNGNRVHTRTRLIRERKASIIATNPAFACGFVADRVLLYLLRMSKVNRKIEVMPETPGYLYLDAATMVAKVIRR